MIVEFVVVEPAVDELAVVVFAVERVPSEVGIDGVAGVAGVVGVEVAVVSAFEFAATGTVFAETIVPVEIAGSSVASAAEETVVVEEMFAVVKMGDVHGYCGQLVVAADLQLVWS